MLCIQLFKSFHWHTFPRLYWCWECALFFNPAILVCPAGSGCRTTCCAQVWCGRSWLKEGQLNSYGTILEIQNIVVKCREWTSDIKGSIRIERLLVKILNKFMVAPRYPEVIIGVTLRSLLDFLGLKSGVKRRRARALRSFTNFASWATLTVRDSLATEQLSLAPKKWIQSNQRLNQLNPSEAFQWTVGGCWNMLELQ